ncbi:YwaF family protein [Heliomicrobium gestii]|uniref:YwaF family protein n=1 Tax=Heliomicrobium gestii TaxID=2699 RepID=UPI0019597821|nr:TIGR02206 family membrane protein [Heliomicrobium gestii]MBM7867853.1 putative integral membrane protein (TIGR02206 family) [Heliomicrobium gestii]
MSAFLVFEPTAEPFIPYSLSHIIVLILLAAIIVGLYLCRDRLSETFRRRFRFSLAAGLFLQELFIQGWNIAGGFWSPDASLPLHLCNVSCLLCGVMLLKGNQTLYEITYFCGLIGAAQALLTPDLGPFAFPHVIFYRFFFAHSAIIIACLYMTFVEKYRPYWASIGKTVVITNLFMLFVGAVDYITGGNYMYLRAKPDNPSLLDILGPWPWYILSLEAVALFLMVIYYLPFAFGDWRKARREKAQIEKAQETASPRSSQGQPPLGM